MQHVMEYAAPDTLHRIPTPTPFPVGAANIYLYKGDCLTLFDAGTHTEDAWGVLTCRLGELGVMPRDIEQIFLTHHHLDHIGLSRRIKDVSGATVYAHPEVARHVEYMYDESLTRVHLEAVMAELGVPMAMANDVIAHRHQHRELLDDFDADRFVEDNTAAGPFEAHFRPGHSATDVLFVHQQERWALTGDHLIRNVTPNPILRRRSETGIREKSLVQYCEALQQTRSLDLGWCFPGHGAAFANHREVVDATFRHIERRNEKVLRVIPTDGATPYEITRLLFRRMSEPQLYYCLSATTGHLELLADQGKLHCRLHEGVYHYHPLRDNLG